MFSFLVVLKDAGFMDRVVGFHTKADAVRAFNWYKNRPCSASHETTLLQGAFKDVSWMGYTFFGRVFTLAHSEREAEAEAE